MLHTTSVRSLATRGFFRAFYDLSKASASTCYQSRRRRAHYTTDVQKPHLETPIADAPVIPEQSKAASTVSVPLQEQMRLAMRNVPHPLAIILAYPPDSTPTEPQNPNSRPFHGMLISSLTTVTMKPEPTVSFNIKVPSRTFEIISADSRPRFTIQLPKSSTFNVGIMDVFTQADMGRVIQRLEARDSSMQVDSKHIVPYMKIPQAARLVCQLNPDVLPIGDHVIATARVVSVEHAPQGFSMMYGGGAFGRFKPMSSEGTDAWKHLTTSTLDGSGDGYPSIKQHQHCEHICGLMKNVRGQQHWHFDPLQLTDGKQLKSFLPPITRVLSQGDITEISGLALQTLQADQVFMNTQIDTVIKSESVDHVLDHAFKFPGRNPLRTYYQTTWGYTKRSAWHAYRQAVCAYMRRNGSPSLVEPFVTRVCGRMPQLGSEGIGKALKTMALPAEWANSLQAVVANAPKVTSPSAWHPLAGEVAIQPTTEAQEGIGASMDSERLEDEEDISVDTDKFVAEMGINAKDIEAQRKHE